MRAPYASFAGATFALSVLQGACAHETQGLIEATAELDVGGAAGMSGANATTGGRSGSGQTSFGGGRASTDADAGTGGFSFSGSFGLPSAGFGGAGGPGGAGGKAGNAGSTGGGGVAGRPEPEPGPCQSSQLSIADATASSEEAATLGAGMACDGVATSRWSSAHSAPQWISLELEELSRVSRVSISWEAAYATDYRVEVSEDADGPWMPLLRDQQANGGTDDLMDFPPATAGFVRVFGLERATVYGFSIFEVDIYGDTNEDCD